MGAVMGVYSVPVVGESFRQKAVKRCRAGDWVLFIPEPGNPKDPEALAIWSVHGQVGYVPAAKRGWIARNVAKSETSVVGRILSVKRPGWFRPYGIRIEALTSRDIPEGLDLTPILRLQRGAL